MEFRQIAGGGMISAMLTWVRDCWRGYDDDDLRVAQRVLNAWWDNGEPYDSHSLTDGQRRAVLQLRYQDGR